MSIRQQGVAHTPAAPRPKAPPAGYAKIHVDAGVRHGRGGFAAAVCRDSNAQYLGSSAPVIGGIDDHVVLEAIACREGLALAEDVHLQNFIITSDSKQVVSNITK